MPLEHHVSLSQDVLNHLWIGLALGLGLQTSLDALDQHLDCVEIVIYGFEQFFRNFEIGVKVQVFEEDQLGFQVAPRF